MVNRRNISSKTPHVDLQRYVPAFLTWIANKLSRGASQHYLRVHGIGIETWRLLVLLAVEGSLSAQHASKVIGMDKASVSRCFKSMHTDGLISMSLDKEDGRRRIATLTTKGRAIHNDILGIALERERTLLSVLEPSEHEVLISILTKLHENLPEVESATSLYVNNHFPKKISNKKSRSSR
jgi:DNA-binding MarR family transcriptional regulator